MMLKVALMGLIFRGFRCGESKTAAESNRGALLLADEASSELESNMALFDDLHLISRTNLA